jgi:trans-aconitate methyltransferase
MNLRALSLDRTPPQDYDPPGTLRWDADLTEIADFFGSDKGALKHNYTPHYERLLGHLRQEPVNLLEIGVACGASLKMWSRFFPYAKIKGVDIRPECQALCGGYPNVEIYIADATKEAVPGQYDVVIDDGSHLPGHIVKSFKLYWPLVRSKGFYFVEDLRCTHNPSYTVPFEFDQADKDRTPFMLMVDSLLRNCDDAGEVASVRFYQELMIVEKR